jgi:hypothetical protein
MVIAISLELAIGIAGIRRGREMHFRPFTARIVGNTEVGPSFAHFARQSHRVELPACEVARRRGR